MEIVAREEIIAIAVFKKILFILFLQVENLPTIDGS